MEDHACRFAGAVDHQSIDEVRITTVPRYKTSFASGDEWRFSARTEVFYKGKLITEQTYGNVEHAIHGLHHLVQEAAWSTTRLTMTPDPIGKICMQEGCSNPATTTYKLKKHYCSCGNESDPYIMSDTPVVRVFCAEHSRRGNCALEDSDKNYELLEGEGPQEPAASAVSPSVVGGVIVLAGQ